MMRPFEMSPGDEEFHITPEQVNATSSVNTECEQYAGVTGQFAFGTIVTIIGDNITVEEYDFAHDSDVKNEYRVDDHTDYGNVSNRADLAAGDKVVVEYIESDGGRLILTLVKEAGHESTSEPD
jgi:hypothetical protein